MISNFRKVAGILLVGCSSMRGAEIWRPPQPVPLACTKPSFEVILIDVSRSMLRAGRFDTARRNATERISTAPHCALVIISSFGLTADVNDAAFVEGQESRERLARAVRALTPSHRATNLDEAAKLIELIKYQLRDAYGSVASSVFVRVYSDFESSPSVGQARSSLGGLVANRLGATYVRLPESDGEPTVARDRGGEQKGTVRRASKTLPQTPLSSKVLWATASCGALILVCFLLRVLIRPQTELPPKWQIPMALVITESLGDDNRHVLMACARAVNIASDVPVVFSTDATCATYVAAELTEGPNGELFRIRPWRHGSFEIETSIAGLTVNDHLVPVNQRVSVDLSSPIRIRLGTREFGICARFDGAAAFKGDAIFEAAPLRR